MFSSFHCELESRQLHFGPGLIYLSCFMVEGGTPVIFYSNIFFHCIIFRLFCDFQSKKIVYMAINRALGGMLELLCGGMSVSGECICLIH